MVIIKSNSLYEGMKDLASLKQYKPFQYSGDYYCFYHDGNTYCYHYEKAMLNKASKLGLEYISVGKVFRNGNLVDTNDAV